jgi:uncharacterized protein
MTPQETQIVDELFDRLAKLEATPRDSGAERVIADGARRAPHALYALVQTALLQDEALKRANARIEELQAQANGATEPVPRPGGSFLDSMRAAFTPGGTRGSVPSVRAQAYPPQTYPPQPGFGPQAAAPGYGAAPSFGAGGSFLGTAASTAAGVLGGALLLDGIRSMFGHRFGSEANASTFGNLGGERTSLWDRTTSGSAADSDLARDAGIDHIGDAIRNDRNDAASGATADPFANTDDPGDDLDVADDTDFAGGFDSGDTYDA